MSMSSKLSVVYFSASFMKLPIPSVSSCSFMISSVSVEYTMFGINSIIARKVIKIAFFICSFSFSFVFKVVFVLLFVALMRLWGLTLI